MKKGWNRGLFLFPVKRKLCVCTAFYLAGILSSLLYAPSLWISCVLCGICLILQAALVHTRRSAVVGLSLFLLFLGNCRMGYLLHTQDSPTESGTAISGTVVRRMSNAYRVELENVTVNGNRLNHDVVVTLMQDENGETVDPPAEGQEISGTGKLFAPDGVRNPGGSDWKLINFSNGYNLSGYLLSGWDAGQSRFSLYYWQRTVHEKWTELIDRVFGENAPFFRALIGGDKSAIDSDTITAMRKTGIVHILTISGLHISLISEMIVFLLQKLKVRRRKKNLILAVVLGIYSFVIGFSVGTVRALIMSGLKEFARDRHCPYDSITATAAAALLMTLVNPAMIFNWSFQFSFFIVFALSLIGTRISVLVVQLPFVRRFPQVLTDALAFCIAAQIAAIPIQLNAYGYYSMLSLPLNLMIGFLMPALIAGGFATVLMGSVWIPAAKPAAWVMGQLSGLVEKASLYFSSVDEAICRLPEPGWLILGLILFCFAIWGGKILFGKLKNKALLATAAAAVLLYAVHFNPAERYVQLDVGQGDAALFRYGRHAVLYDVGPSASYDVLNYLRHEGLRVDGVILSHLDDDHAGALEKLVGSEISVERLISAEKDAEGTESEEARLAWNTAITNGTKLLTVAAGDCFTVGKVQFSVLSPSPEMIGDNERSLVLYTEMQDTRFLLTGDLPAKNEPAAIPDTDVLKVAHHGSKNSTSPEFLQTCTPKYAMISVGANNHYGHPGDRVLNDLAAVGAEILRTDENGCITLWLQDNGTIKKEVFLK